MNPNNNLHLDGAYRKCVISRNITRHTGSLQCDVRDLRLVQASSDLHVRRLWMSGLFHNRLSLEPKFELALDQELELEFSIYSKIARTDFEIQSRAIPYNAAAQTLQDIEIH